MKISINVKKKPWLCLGFATLLSACNWSDPVRVENDFGNSVRHMIKQQTQNSDVTTQKPMTQKLDGETVVNSLETYRKNQKRSHEDGTLEDFEIGK